MMDTSTSADVVLSTMESVPQADPQECNESKKHDIANHSVSILDLPHRWDEIGALTPESSPAPCSRCKWDGDPKYLIRRTACVRNWGFLIPEKSFQAEPFECVCCEIMRLLLLRVSQDVLAAIKTTTSVSIHNSGLWHIYDLQDTDEIVQDVFISDESERSTIDLYNIARRRMVSTGVQWASYLISECVRFHDECQSEFKGGYLPTRLINIRRDEHGGNPRLELQASRAVPPGSSYVALSYRWGGHEPACMTNKLDAIGDDNLKSIPWIDLPRTFQDAVKFTLALGIHYLWIDSICIIQGDSQDWIQEAPKMHAVYKNSYVTLAALCGRDSRNGLRTSSVKESSSPFVQLRTAQTTHVLYTRPCHYLDSEIEDRPNRASRLCGSYSLLDRAWAYQERIVSSRVIFFTESEMIYQCQCYVACECGSSREYYNHKSMLSKLNKSRIGSATKRFPDSNTDSPRSLECNSFYRSRIQSAARIWRNNVVPEYSRLNISDSKDRLPAIGAIAEEFKGIRNREDYLAGLWSGTLLEDLLWRCVPYRLGMLDFAKKERLARFDGLPTWTWASIHSQVAYPKGDMQIDDKANIVKAQCKYTQNKAFGTLESSRLELNGRVLVCILDWNPPSFQTQLLFEKGDARTQINDFTNDDIDRSVKIWLDCDREGFQYLSSLQTVHIIEISTIESDNNHEYKEWHFLLLHPAAECQGKIPGTQVFTRGGLVIIEETTTHRRRYQAKASPVVSGFEELGPGWFQLVMENHSEWTTCEIW